MNEHTMRTDEHASARGRRWSSPTARRSRASCSARPGVATGEVIFNTALSGYQEIVTDPSYAGQIITFTNPHIGNYGVNQRDFESRRLFCRGVVVRELARRPSNRRSEGDLDAMLAPLRRSRHHRHRHPPADPADPRHRRHPRRVRPGRRHRRRGRRGRGRARAPTALDLVATVTTAEPYTVGAGGGRRIVAYDYGIKRTILRHLAGLGTVEVVPATTPAADTWPSSPTASSCPTAPATRRASPAPPTSSATCSAPASRSSASASATSCSVRRSGRRRSSCRSATTAPTTRCSDLTTGAIEITSQNHNFAVSPSTGWPAWPTLTHVNLNDGVCEGLPAHDANAFSVQHHPEAGPGPHDSSYLFARFAERMITYRGGGWAPAPIPMPVPAERARRAPRARSRGWPDMPRRDDLTSILVIGSGPIVIGQACEFDYSGTQACRVLREEGYRVILANSNPATIMTDPDFADRTYIEPLTPGGAGGDHRPRASRRRAADARRPDRSEHRHGPVRRGTDRRARDDRR